MKRLIKAGWNSYLSNVIPPDAPEIQVNECRIAFYGGAAILFNTILLIMDDDREPTEDDLQVMSDIQNELNEYGQELDRAILGNTTP